MFDYKGLRTWSDEEWNRLPLEDRPSGAIRFGSGWALLADESSASTEAPVDNPDLTNPNPGQITKRAGSAT